MATEQSAIALFLATLDGQTLDEAMANLEADARSYGWSRKGIRDAAHRIRIRFARKVA